MEEPWRRILERAAANLSIELKGKGSEPLNGRGDPRMPDWLSAAHPSSFAQSRDLLARQLGTKSSPAVEEQPNQQADANGIADKPTITVPVTALPADLQPRSVDPWKRNRRRNLVVVALFATVLGLTPYAFLPHGRLPKAEAPELGDTSKQNLGAVINQAEDPLARASYQLNHGDEAGARSTYQAMAQNGNPHAAFRLAETYDPSIVVQHQEWGLKPDARLARKWYKKALQLGSADASKRLKNLAASR